MLNKILLTTFICFAANFIQAQQLLFTNTTSGKVITVKPGNKLYLAYKGYNGIQEFAANTVTMITDSTITLGFDPNALFTRKKPNASVNSYKVINLKDITHFRKRSIGGEFVKDMLKIGAIIGTAFVLTDLYASNNVSRGNAFLISLGTGMVVNFGIRLVFPENAKYRVSDGWQLKGSGYIP